MVACEREYITRRKDGSLSNGREPLNVNELFTLLSQDDDLDQGIPPETRVGHVHLHVRDIDEAVDFYHGVIGFDVMGVAKAFRMGFVSAVVIHHHLGLNTWQGEVLRTSRRRGGDCATSPCNFRPGSTGQGHRAYRRAGIPPTKPG
jgi:catechol-2,3-dioxygenase